MATPVWLIKQEPTPVEGAEVSPRPDFCACPWCHQALVETCNLDGQMLGFFFTQRTYICPGCGVRVGVCSRAIPR